jgi:hypothetical protein
VGGSDLERVLYHLFLSIAAVSGNVVQHHMSVNDINPLKTKRICFI